MAQIQMMLLERSFRYSMTLTPREQWELQDEQEEDEEGEDEMEEDDEVDDMENEVFAMARENDEMGVKELAELE